MFDKIKEKLWGNKVLSISLIALVFALSAGAYIYTGQTPEEETPPSFNFGAALLQGRLALGNFVVYNESDRATWVRTEDRLGRASLQRLTAQGALYYAEDNLTLADLLNPEKCMNPAVERLAFFTYSPGGEYGDNGAGFYIYPARLASGGGALETPIYGIEYPENFTIKKGRVFGLLAKNASNVSVGCIKNHEILATQAPDLSGITTGWVQIAAHEDNINTLLQDLNNALDDEVEVKSMWEQTSRQKFEKLIYTKTGGFLTSFTEEKTFFERVAGALKTNSNEISASTIAFNNLNSPFASPTTSTSNSTETPWARDSSSDSSEEPWRSTPGSSENTLFQTEHSVHSDGDRGKTFNLVWIRVGQIANRIIPPDSDSPDPEPEPEPEGPGAFTLESVESGWNQILKNYVVLSFNGEVDSNPNLDYFKISRNPYYLMKLEIKNITRGARGDSLTLYTADQSDIDYVLTINNNFTSSDGRRLTTNRYEFMGTAVPVEEPVPVDETVGCWGQEKLSYDGLEYSIGLIEGECWMMEPSKYIFTPFHDWATAMRPETTCPAGWRLPSQNELKSYFEKIIETDLVNIEKFLIGMWMVDEVSYEGSIGQFWTKDEDTNNRAKTVIVNKDKNLSFLSLQRFLLAGVICKKN
jgi:hypothetical protein